MAETGRLKTDPLFLGLTRPPMMFGVSYMFFALNLLANMVYMINSSNIIGMVLCICVIHAIGFLLTRHEPLFIQLYMIRGQKCMKCRNRSFHNGTNSYDAF
ncbi:MAG: VirB3 family type IV secretion system protein [Alphaproteobacteria bacterium]|nr:VirB3 family type IV secretion system protein [Alphaproteobacteria bacterium]